jgi:hypothetical protein
LPVHRRASHTACVIPNVILHLINDLPVVADLDDLPAGGDRSVRCTNIRTVDGKRPAFVHDKNSTFIFPMSMIRLIEAPHAGSETSEEFGAQTGLTVIPEVTTPPSPPPLDEDEEPDEDLLARMRSI